MEFVHFRPMKIGKSFYDIAAVLFATNYNRPGVNENRMWKAMEENRIGGI
jgi:hypothetical protein